MWRVCVSLGCINSGGFLMPPRTRLGHLQYFCGNAMHKHCIFSTYSLHTCHDHCWNAWKSCLGIVFCAHHEACHVFNKELISPLISSFPCNQLITGYVWIHSILDTYMCGRIQSSEPFIESRVGWQGRRVLFILSLRWNSDCPTRSMYGLHLCRS